MGKWVAKNLRVLASIFTALVVFVGAASVISIIAGRFPGGIGLIIAFVAGISLTLAVLLVYWNVVDWLNIRIIQRQLVRGRPVLRDGQITAFCGTVRRDGAPLTSPFSEKACAAYTYVIAISRSPTQSANKRTRIVLAQGFHMNRTRIEGATHSVRIGSLPGFEDELQRNLHGVEWLEKARAQISKVAATASALGQKEPYARLLEARHSVAEEFHQDFTKDGDMGDGATLVVDEEILPVDQSVCVIGTYDDRLKGLTARKPRLGPNLMIYQGTVEEVLTRVGNDLAWFSKAAGILMAVGFVPLIIALLPPDWMATLPIVGSLFGQ